MVERLNDQDHHSTDITVLTNQIQFARGDKSSFCRLSVTNDSLYEGLEQFSVKLSSPDRTILGDKHEAMLSLTDPEDGKLICRFTFYNTCI